MKVLKQLLEQRDATAKSLRELEDAVKQEDGTSRDLTPEEEQRSLKLLDEVDGLEQQIKDETKREKRKAKLSEARELISGGDSADVKVESEPMQYGIHSNGEHSFFADMIRFQMGPMIGGIDPAVGQRMATWAHQVEREVAHDTERGRDALVQLRGMDGIRTENGMQAQRILSEVRDRGRASLEAKAQEFRAGGITTGGGATASAAGGGGAAFVVPVFYEGDYAPWREAGRAFADQCNQKPLPPYGMTVYLPAITGPAQVATQTVEGGGIAETDPTAGFIAGGLITTAGQVTVTQQLLDRAGPNVQFDQILFDQLRRDYAPKWDTYVLQQALANAGAVTFTAGSWAFAAAPGTASFVSKFAGAINAIETTAGTIMSPTHAFVQPSRWNFIESVGALESSSGNLHPLIVPSNNGPFNAFASGNQSGYVPFEGDTGYKMFGLPILKDLNIPTPGAGADQAIVANLSQVYAYEGPLVPRVVPQTLAPNLAVLLQLYSYGTAIVRYPKAVQTVSGTGMATIVF